MIGFMGTGKTAVGKRLAQSLKWSFYDTDEMIAQQTGVSIAEIFAKKGEPFFRETETAALGLLSPLDRCVVSTGGGIVLSDDNKKMLKANSRVVHLNANPETILERVGEDRLRPLLPKGPLAFESLKTLLAERMPHYEAVRDFSVATDSLSEADVATVVLKDLEGKI